MNRLRIAIIGSGLLVAGALGAQDQPAAAPPAFRSEQEKVGYAWGLLTARNLKLNGADFDMNFAARGLRDGLSNGPALLTEAEARSNLTAYGELMRTRQADRLKQQGEKNRQEGDVFLAQNKSKPGVIPLPSGLQYKVLAEGHGESPAAHDSVTIKYRAMMVDETEFDSSEKHPAPTTFRLDGPTIPKGVAEGLQLMKPGAKWQLFIPAALAYGERPPPGTPIGPGAALIYEVELVSSTPPPAPAAAATPAGQPLTSDIIKVPSADEIKKGAKIETIKAEDIEKEIQKEKK